MGKGKKYCAECKKELGEKEPSKVAEYILRLPAFDKFREE
jgi:hypothetical protein